MDEHEIIRKDGPKDHVRPSIAANEIGRYKEWNDDHEEGVENMSIERAKQSWIRPTMMGFMSGTIESRYAMFCYMGNIHEKVHAGEDHQAGLWADDRY